VSRGGSKNKSISKWGAELPEKKKKLELEHGHSKRGAIEQAVGGGILLEFEQFGQRTIKTRPTG